MIQRYYLDWEERQSFLDNSGHWCKDEDVTELESEIAAVQAENGKLQILLFTKWCMMSRAEGETAISAKMPAKFNDWLKQKLEGK